MRGDDATRATNSTARNQRTHLLRDVRGLSRSWWRAAPSSALLVSRAQLGRIGAPRRSTVRATKLRETRRTAKSIRRPEQAAHAPASGVAPFADRSEPLEHSVRGDGGRRAPCPTLRRSDVGRTRAPLRPRRRERGAGEEQYRAGPDCRGVCRRQRPVASSSRRGACSIVDDRFCATRRHDVAGAASAYRRSIVDDRFCATRRDDVAGAASAGRRSVVDDRFCRCRPGRRSRCRLRLPQEHR